MRLFQPGETVVRREIMRGEVWFAYPSICVSDDGDQLVTFLPGGTHFGFPSQGAFPAGEHPWKAAGHTFWNGHGMLAIHWAEVDHAIFVFWNNGGASLSGSAAAAARHDSPLSPGEERVRDCWYFNLQDAPRRTPIGFDTVDHELDIVWKNGAPTWEWKDVDEFAATGELRYPGRTHEIQAEGDRIAKALDAGERWWDASWEYWTPPVLEAGSGWTAPELPANWLDIPFTTR
jgi:hypothetical protein